MPPPLPSAVAIPSKASARIETARDAGLQRAPSTEALHAQIRRRRWSVDDSPSENANPAESSPSEPATQNASAAKTPASMVRLAVEGIALVAAVVAGYAFFETKFSNTPPSARSILISQTIGHGLAAWLIAYLGYRMFRRSWTAAWVAAGLVFLSSFLAERDRGASSAALSSLDKSVSDLRQQNREEYRTTGATEGRRARLAAAREQALRTSESLRGEEKVVFEAWLPDILGALDLELELTALETDWVAAGFVAARTPNAPCAMAEVQQFLADIERMRELNDGVTDRLKKAPANARHKLKRAGLADYRITQGLAAFESTSHLTSQLPYRSLYSERLALERALLRLRISESEHQRGTASRPNAAASTERTLSELAEIDRRMKEWTDGYYGAGTPR